MLDKFCATPIHRLNYSEGNNNFYIKRDDLLPYSFGGNKVRIAQKYFQDMMQKNCNCIITYGKSQSNLCRAIANMSKSYGVPCYVISPVDSSAVDSSGECHENYNRIFVNMFGAQIIECDKNDVARTVGEVMNHCIQSGLNPYYTYGDVYGRGNTNVAVESYVEVYEEILQFEINNDILFDYIFLASATGTTQSGLVCGSLLNKDIRNIVGISVARDAELGREIISNNVSEYMGVRGGLSRRDSICFEDKYLIGGYGEYNAEVSSIIEKMLEFDGVPLDNTYTGKSFWGMTEYLKEGSIVNKKILFIHTGGLPLFFSSIDRQKGNTAIHDQLEAGI